MKIIKTLILVLSCTSAWAQVVENPKDAVLINPYVGFQLYDGDIADQYKSSVKLGIASGYKFKSDYILMLEGSYTFGNNVKNADNILQGIATADGNIINESGNYAQFSLFQRGITYGLSLEKVFPAFLSSNKNSGPTLGIGVGQIWNWTRIENVGNDTPNLIDDYKKGYDQLSSGPYIKESIGYLFLSPNRLINFSVNFEVYQAFTKNLRKYNYAGGYYSNESRLDLSYGIRINWYLPIYQGGKEQYYYE